MTLTIFLGVEYLSASKDPLLYISPSWVYNHIPRSRWLRDGLSRSSFLHLYPRIVWCSFSSDFSAELEPYHRCLFPIPRFRSKFALTSRMKLYVPALLLPKRRRLLLYYKIHRFLACPITSNPQTLADSRFEAEGGWAGSMARKKKNKYCEIIFNMVQSMARSISTGE